MLLDFILNPLRPKILADYPSKFNGRVVVRQGPGYISITTDNAFITQSGEILKAVWTPTLKKIAKKHKRWLILGLAGGTLATIISKKYSPDLMVGVEIDPVMIKAGKKYFHLDEIPNLKIINQDANVYTQQVNDHFDYVLVDMYIGDQVPRFLDSPIFLKRLKKLGDVVVFNRLFYDLPTRYQAQKFIEKISPIFPTQQLVRSLANILIICG